METSSVHHPAPVNSFLDVALIGNPNTGKTSIFNGLTGLRQKVSNYPGVTVEKKTGMVLSDEGEIIRLHDLPGLYSLNPKSLDERIAREILLGESDEPIDIRVVVVVADASNLNRNLYLVTQVIDLGIPVIVALNMMDSAEATGLRIDLEELARRLNVRIVPVIATRQSGIDDLRRAMFAMARRTDQPPPQSSLPLDASLDRMIQPLVLWIAEHTRLRPSAQTSEALRALSSDLGLDVYRKGDYTDACKKDLEERVASIRHQMEQQGTAWRMLETTLRYRHIDDIYAASVHEIPGAGHSLSARLDRILTHRFVGPLAALGLFALIFQAIFSWAEIPMDAIEDAMARLGAYVTTLIPEGTLRSLLVDGVIAGVGAVLVFLPQILFLFFFLALLEDTGYMARVAFLMDRLMQSLGLSGRSVIPLLSSFACAIPGIMATRTIVGWRDRLITIMIAPFMSCSARLPVYILMIGAFFPDTPVLGVFSLPALILLSMYLTGVAAAIVVALAFKKLVLTDQPSASFIMELPPYRRPSIRWILIQMVERARVFLTDAGKIILAVSIALWFLASYPRPESYEDMSPKERIAQSYVGQLGRLIEPVIQPLGFDWKFGVGIITSFAAREVLVSALATIYNVEQADETSVDLRSALRNEVHPETGARVYSPLVALSLMVFFVLACQCMATVAIVKRETNSWRWPLIMIALMTTMAWCGSFVVFQGGRLIGLG